MKIDKKLFELFKVECHKWIDEFQLNDYDVFFELKKIDNNADARSFIAGGIGNITIILNNEINLSDENPEKYIKEAAKHEIIHCLLGRFSNLARSRYINEGEISNEEEHLVRKLCKIIK